MWRGERSACSCACRAKPGEVGVYGGAPTRAPGLHCRGHVAQAPPQSPQGPPCAGAGVPRGAVASSAAAGRAILSMRPRMQPCDLVQAALDHPTRIHQQHHLPRDGIGSSLDPPPCVPPHVQGRTSSPTPCMRIVHCACASFCLVFRRTVLPQSAELLDRRAPAFDGRFAKRRTDSEARRPGKITLLMGRQQQRMAGWSRPTHVRCDRPASRSCNAASRPPSPTPKTRW